jgi:two-component system KDP operon response regulator KdpE
MTTGARILVVDDEPVVRNTLRNILEAHGYAVITAESGEDALQAFGQRRPDLILMDIVMPGMGGIEAIRRLREQSTVPIIVISVLAGEDQKVQALETGADDYVTKPFGIKELTARIRSTLRRAAGAKSSAPVFTAGELSVNFDRREVRLGGEPVKLTPMEYDLLKYMIEHDGKVLTHNMLLSAVWGLAHVERTEYLRVFIGQLRKKLERDPAQPRFIVTDPGVGYRFCSEPNEEESG